MKEKIIYKTIDINQLSINYFQSWVKEDKNRAGNLSWNKIFHEFVELPFLPSCMNLEFFDIFAKRKWKN